VYTQLVLIIGITVTCVACVWLSVITHCNLSTFLVIISAVFLGAGCAVLLVSAISMATEIIGSYSVRFCCVLHAITVQSASQSVGVCNTSRHPHMGVASSRQEEAIASSWILQNKKKTTRLINCLVCRKLRGGRLVEVQRKSEGRKEKFSGALPLCARIRAPSLSIFFLRL